MFGGLSESSSRALALEIGHPQRLLSRHSLSKVS